MKEVIKCVSKVIAEALRVLTVVLIKLSGFSIDSFLRYDKIEMHEGLLNMVCWIRWFHNHLSETLKRMLSHLDSLTAASSGISIDFLPSPLTKLSQYTILSLTLFLCTFFMTIKSTMGPAISFRLNNKTGRVSVAREKFCGQSFGWEKVQLEDFRLRRRLTSKVSVEDLDFG